MANGVNAADSQFRGYGWRSVFRAVRSAVRMWAADSPAVGAGREGAQRGARLGRVRARRERASEEGLSGPALPALGGHESAQEPRLGITAGSLQTGQRGVGERGVSQVEQDRRRRRGPAGIVR